MQVEDDVKVFGCPQQPIGAFAVRRSAAMSFFSLLTTARLDPRTSREGASGGIVVASWTSCVMALQRLKLSDGRSALGFRLVWKSSARRNRSVDSAKRIAPLFFARSDATIKAGRSSVCQPAAVSLKTAMTRPPC